MPASVRARAFCGLFERSRTLPMPSSCKIAAGKLKSQIRGEALPHGSPRSYRGRRLVVHTPGVSPSTRCRDPPRVRKSPAPVLLPRSQPSRSSTDRCNRIAVTLLPHLAGDTLRMNAKEWSIRREITHRQDHRRIDTPAAVASLAHEAEGLKHTPPRWNSSRGHPSNWAQLCGSCHG